MGWHELLKSARRGIGTALWRSPEEKRRRGEMEGGRDDKVLSYGDVLLRRSDVELLDGPYYLNDQIIEFSFHYLTAKLAKSSPATPARLLLVGPAQTFWLLHCPDSDSLNASIDPLQLANREMVIFALNNNEDVKMAEGGSHWTLLVYTRHENAFEHYDSLAGCNRRHARKLVNIIKPFIGKESSHAKLVEPVTPQQENGYDCGVYLMAITQVLCDSFMKQQRAIPSHDVAGLLRTQVTPSRVHKMRSTTLELIAQLACQSSCKK